MSPGATFERVYRELKRMLAEGELPPGMPIEPTVIGKQIGSSITPVRDALHRLTGERLVEAPNHNGFRVPLLTEAGLRDLYAWNEQLLTLARRRALKAGDEVVAEAIRGGDIGNSAASLFATIARATGSAEHSYALQQANDRLAPYRRAEAKVLSSGVAELEEIAYGWSDGQTIFVRLVRAYHKRRIESVAALTDYMSPHVS